MSNQCSNLFNYRSFIHFPPFHTPLKPYHTTSRPVFPFHGNLILIGRRSGNSTSLHPPIAVQSSSDVVLITTTEHQDGSLIFQFGDASEVVENEVLEELESKAELENSVVKVVGGDLEKQVALKTIEGEDGSDGRSLTEVADEVRNADIENEVSERENNVTSGLKDYHADTTERLPHRPEEEVLSSQSDANTYNTLEDVESTLDKSESTAQLDRDESLIPIISFFDNSLNTDKSAEPQGTLSKDGDDETDDQFVSGKLESVQASDIEVMDVKLPYAKDELDYVESVDASECNTEDLIPPATIHISEVDLTNAANEDVNEELQDMNISGVTLIDEMSPLDPLGDEPLDEVCQFQSVDVKVETTMEVSSTEAMDVKDWALENELQEVDVNKTDENDVADAMPVTCVEEAGPILEENVSQPQSTPVPLKSTMQVSDIELHDDTMAQNQYDVILQTDDETVDTLVSANLENMQVELMDITQTDELHKVESEDTTTSNMEDLPPSTILSIPNAEVMDAPIEDMDEGFQDMNINEGTLIDEMPPSDPPGGEPTLDEVSQIQLADVKLEATMEVSTTKGIDVNDQPVEDELQQVNCVMPITRIEEAEPILEEEVSQPESTPQVLPSMQVSDIELQDTIDLNSDDEILQVADETEDPSESVKLETMQVSEFEVMNELLEVETKDAKENDAEDSMCLETMHTSDIELTEAANGDMVEGLQDMDIDEGTLIYGLPPSDTLRAEPTSNDVSQLQSANAKLEVAMEVVASEDMNVEDLAVEDELPQVSTDKSDENDVVYVVPAEPILKEEENQPCLNIQVTDTEVQDTEGQSLDDVILQIIEEDAGENYIKDVERSLHQLEAQLVQDEGGKHNMLEQCAEIDALRSSNMLDGSQLEAERIEGKVSSSELAEASEETAILFATISQVEREEIYLTDTDYILSSGTALLEHPFKELTGGDDAYFVASSKWVGVANGVSQWSFEGTDPGVYAQELMRTCEEIVSSVPMNNPVDLLCRGVKETIMSGSSNILIANFDGQALHVANIGDTGFIIIRHGTIYKKSSPLLHEFHFALQLEDHDDPLQLVEEYTIGLEEGDIVVSATDGLFDNLYEQEIAMVVSKSLQAGMKPEEVAKVLATRAQEVGRSAFVRSPFSDAAQAAGYTGYSGGKPDNVAVIVSLVEKRSAAL